MKKLKKCLLCSTILGLTVILVGLTVSSCSFLKNLEIFFNEKPKKPNEPDMTWYDTNDQFPPGA